MRAGKERQLTRPWIEVEVTVVGPMWFRGRVKGGGEWLTRLHEKDVAVVLVNGG